MNRVDFQLNYYRFEIPNQLSNLYFRMLNIGHSFILSQLGLTNFKYSQVLNLQMLSIQSPQ